MVAMMQYVADGHPFVRYAMSAAVSVVANIVAQQATVLGLGIGYVVKFQLDRRHVFQGATV
ncbi:hypothetical protein L0664_05090 [Octadecabacter sp. G9-8]|uniref:GtrA-like protein domain-containing protein n=1 Tax=Octadecabacter dasysiphoniae TaxID=2909341 RepID=A0ABS9CVM6_9RHOB|nr:hypothetical protein [Octadecabacter dasysiphoniae]MCF2870435.1 hypothetical protein [Octadecabacter dasysiphoniae]